MSGVITSIQQQAVKVMTADAYYSRVAVIPEQQPGDLASMARQALAKAGICCIVFTPNVTFRHTDAPGPQIDPLTVSIDIMENVAANRGSAGSQLPASDVAEHTAWLLHYPNHPARNDVWRLIAASLRLVPDTGKQLLVFRVTFNSVGSLAGLEQEKS